MNRSILVDIILRPIIITISALFFRMKVTNRRNCPKKGPLILAGNHISNWDPPFIAAAVPRAVYFMAKLSLFKPPFWNWAMNKLGAFPINRRSSVNSGAIHSAVNLVSAGKAVIIFPEGTRSKDGNLLPAKAGVGYIANATHAPVLPFCLNGMDKPKETLLFKSRFSVVFGELISAEELDEKHKVGGAQGVADYIMKKVQEIKTIEEKKGTKNDRKK